MAKKTIKSDKGMRTKSIILMATGIVAIIFAYSQKNWILAELAIVILLSSSLAAYWSKGK